MVGRGRIDWPVQLRRQNKTVTNHILTKSPQFYFIHIDVARWNQLIRKVTGPLDRFSFPRLLKALVGVVPSLNISERTSPREAAMRALQSLA
jgi:hypothetical protein